MKSILLLALGFSAIASAAELKVTETEETISITRGDVPVLSYHKADIPAPEGQDPVFARSAFIHPLCTPSGQPLTGIQPSDHYHHAGVFHAWVHTKHGYDHPDFWNIGDKTGRVRYAETVGIRPPTAADPSAGFTVVQEHVAYKGKEDAGTVVLREELTVTVTAGDDTNLIGYNVKQTNITDTALELPEYRYGGCLAWRGPHDWKAKNSEILTSEGKTRKDSHMSRAKWIAFHGPTATGRATFGVLMDPKNHDSPQRLRTWSKKETNGAPFLCIVPVQETGWEIKPGETITMSYTIVTADSELDAAALEAAWKKSAP